MCLSLSCVSLLKKSPFLHDWLNKSTKWDRYFLFKAYTNYLQIQRCFLCCLVHT